MDDDDSGSGTPSNCDIWVRDSKGRVGKLLHRQTRILYASGEQRCPTEYTEISDSDSAEYDFATQRDAMWAACTELDSLNRRILSRMTRGREDLRPESLRYEELLADVGVKTMRRAVLLYVATKCGSSMQGYVGKCLKRAYARALSRRDKGMGLGTTVISDNWKRKPSSELVSSLKPEHSGLDAKNQLSIIIEQAKLTEEEVSLLMSRYDSEETLRDLAEQLDVSSPQTVLNCINRILERCRKTLPNT